MGRGLYIAIGFIAGAFWMAILLFGFYFLWKEGLLSFLYGAHTFVEGTWTK